MFDLSRRRFVGATAALAAFGARPVFAADKTVRIGCQKYGNLLLLKASGRLEERLQPLGWSVEWKQFISGPPLMEALAAGAIDFGLAGETPPIFSQAAGAQIVYRSVEPPAPRAEAILVAKDSPIAKLQDLRGKKIALNKGSNVHYLFVRALEKAGLALHDVSVIYLSPPDGRAAFERGSVDAWVIWDPFLAAAQATGRTRVLVDGEGLVDNHQFYISSRRFTDQVALQAVDAAIEDVDRQAAKDHDWAAGILAPAIGLPPDVIKVALARQSFSVRPVDRKVADAQQKIGDTFFKLKLIPRAIRIDEAMPAAG
jgi:sulfonate transport system substrate-binding protein